MLSGVLGVVFVVVRGVVSVEDNMSLFGSLPLSLSPSVSTVSFSLSLSLSPSSGSAGVSRSSGPFITAAAAAMSDTAS